MSTAEDTLSLGKDPKFLCGVAVSVYQNSGASTLFGSANLQNQIDFAIVCAGVVLPPTHACHWYHGFTNNA